MRPRNSSILVLIALVTGVAGCATARSQVAARDTTPTQPAASADEWARYAEVLRVAYETYEGDVLYALSLGCQSEAEASAVADAHTAARFATYTEEALRRRGLTLADLEAFSEGHPEFVAEQRALYSPRLARLESMLQDEVVRLQDDPRDDLAQLIDAFPDEEE